MEDIYKNLNLNDIPWNNESPPDALVKLCGSGIIKPCKAIDLGCGAGNYSVYLARLGFDMTGVDILPTAIEIAKGNAVRNGVKCDFIQADLTSGTDIITETFDFALEWQLMHHIYPEQRYKYTENVYKILNPGAKYLSVCFSEQDKLFGGEGKYRKTSIGTLLYFSSEEEMEKLFKPYFKILELKTIENKGKSANHQVIYSFMEKK